MNTTPRVIQLYLHRHLRELLNRRTNKAEQLRLDIGRYLDEGKSIREIMKITGLQSDAYISGIITRYYPDHSKHSKAMAKVKKIKDLLDQNYTTWTIAEQLDTTQSSISTLMQKYLPEYTDEYKRQIIIGKIKLLLDQGYSYTAIAKELKLSGQCCEILC